MGRTPLVPLRSVARDGGPGFELWAKVESFNPSGSVKDRPALAIVRAAWAQGALGPGRTLVDASSGNTAVAYSWLGSRLGFGVRLYVPSNANPSRLRAMRSFGADVVLTEPGEGTDGARVQAREYALARPTTCFFADQYNNPANPGAHFAGTGPEIWRQCGGQLSHFVAGVGTGGTVSGAGRFLKGEAPGLRVVGVEPTGPMHGLEGLKHLPTAVRPSTYDAAVLDTTVRVDTEAALRMVERLAREEGLRVGPSSGAAVVAALAVAETDPRAFVVTLLADGGEPQDGSEP